MSISQTINPITSVASPSSTSASPARTRPWPIKRVSSSSMPSSTAPRTRLGPGPHPGHRLRLGRTGRTAAGRHGFQELVALVNQEQVGIIFAYDVTRLARNCTDWYQLLDLCGYRCCLVGDQDGIYDPATPDGRLILGLKGLISELELHTLRGRPDRRTPQQGRRGELALSLPIGLVRDALGRVLKHPDQEVQDRLDLVFTTFLRIKAACRVVQLFNDRELLLPRRDRFGDLVWRRPTASAILSILKNPAYAGAFVYGRTRAVPRADAPH